MNKNKKTLIAAIPLFLIVILVFAGFGVWKKYRDTLMQNQEEQMLLTTRILSENMAMSAEEYEESLSFLAKTAENRPQGEAKQLYREFIDTQTSFITNLYLEDEQGKLSESVKDVQIEVHSCSLKARQRIAFIWKKIQMGKSIMYISVF